MWVVGFVGLDEPNLALYRKPAKIEQLSRRIFCSPSFGELAPD